MKPRLCHLQNRALRGRHSTRGYALILVLGVLVLSALMVIVMLERSSSSLQSTVAYSQVAQIRSFSDMAVNLVQAQIWDATTTNQTTATPLAQRSTWASQPGAIRVYGTGTAAASIFKLYSSETMMTNNANLAADVPATWFSRPTEFTDLNEPVRDAGTSRYPIMDPGAAAANPGATGIANGFSIGAAAPVASGASANSGPMPVRWIYVLEDGTLCQLGDARIDRDTNPLIGRIAFWTDDETSKVNLNTASPTTAASAWDTPRGSSSGVTSSGEGRLAWNQPAQNEYQRYPGHPAMVSLRPILGDLGALGNSGFYDLTPRYRWGGSEDGAKSITVARTSLLTNKEDRLYVTNDELLFKSTPSGSRNAAGAAQVESLKFFLTSSSRAPELNLFGQPRVSIWPVSSSNLATRRTAFDNLIAFCSTIGGKAYYFVREFPLSTVQDYDNFPRNQQLYSYLQRMTAAQVPGFGGTTFLDKYGTDRDQILTEIFDYIRCTNLNETYEGKAAAFESYTPDMEGAFNAIGDIPAQAGAGFVVPIQIGSTRGGGRFPAITGGGLWFVQHLENPKMVESGSNTRQLQAALILKTTTPMHGFMPWQAKDVTFRIRNATMSFFVDGEPNIGGFPGGTTTSIDYAPFARSATGSSPGGYDGSLWPLARVVQWLGNSNATPFYSTNIPVGSSTTFSVLSGSVIIDIRVAGQVVQTYQLDFPAFAAMVLPTVDPKEEDSDFPGLPQAWWYARATNPSYMPIGGDILRSVELSHGDARLALMAETGLAAPFSDFERHEDYDDISKRFAHSMRGTDSRSFLWQGGTAGSYVAGLSYSVSGTTQQLNFGDVTKVSTKAFNYTSGPDIPSRITDLRAQGWSGDFDNGIGNFPDGSFLNKPDEGSDSASNTEIPYSRMKWETADGLFSPLRQVPSAVMFGSLPTGVKANVPWRTLLFCPNPSDPGHRGFNDPPDHLLLDLFRMPVVEPYSMSGPASTDGKINMNYAIAPFSYIRRASAWYAVLEALKVFAIPDTASATYKNTTNAATPNMRFSVDVDETLKQFETRFANNEIFGSATEICSLFLVPQGETLAGVSNLGVGGYWSKHRLTGDNSREKPYAELYPKLTTQSNTYRLHMRVQTIPKSDAAPASGADFVPRAEYRGSVLLERYLDLDDSRLTSNAVDPDDDCLNEIYKFRILETRRFSP